jgi:hypothetical protein
MSESRSSSNSRSITHFRLIRILREIRDSASNKSTWDDALNSANDMSSPGSRVHSLETVSNAIKVMLEDYLDQITIIQDLGSDEEVSELPSIPVPAGVEEYVLSPPPRLVTDERLLGEMDELRDKLTKLEIECSKLREENEKFENENFNLNSKLNKIESSCSNLSSDETPNLSQWRILQAQLQYLRSAVSGDTAAQMAPIESLSAQVQTLEVQKGDADAEITRLRGQLAVQPRASVVSTPSVRSMKSIPIFTTPIPTATRRSTVSVHKFTPPPAPSVVGSDFIEVGTDQPKRRKSRLKRQESSGIIDSIFNLF